MKANFSLWSALCAVTLAGLLWGAGLSETQAGLATEPFSAWQVRHKTPGRVFDAAFGNGVHVVVGEDGLILASSDGVEWTERTSGTSFPIIAIGFGRGRFVASATNPDFRGEHLLLVSEEGGRWDHIPMGDVPVLSIAYGANRFVAVTDRGVRTSLDGLQWHPPPDLDPGWFAKIAYGNGKFVAIRDRMTATSIDGLTWTALNNTGSESLRTLAFGNGVFVAAGTGNRLLRSEDGENWTPATIAVTGGPATFHALGFANNTFLLTGIRAQGGTSVLYTSSDGRGWVAQDPPFFRIETFSSGHGLIIAGGDAAGVATSDTGRKWTLRRPGFHRGLNAVAHGQGVFVAVGSEFDPKEFRYPVIVRSTDGVQWSRQPVQESRSVQLVDVEFGGTTFLAIGRKFPDEHVIYASRDGAAWVESLSKAGMPLNAVAWGGGRFVAVGDRGTVVTSRDTLAWEHPAALTTMDLVDVAYGNGTFVAVGGHRSHPGFYETAVVLTSRDGLTWTQRDVGRGNILFGVTFGNNTFLAARWFGPYLTSTDGETWRSHDLGGKPVFASTVTYAPMSGVDYARGWFFAWDSLQMWYSADLLSWHQRRIRFGPVAHDGQSAVLAAATVFQAELLGPPFEVSVTGRQGLAEAGAEAGRFTLRREGPVGIDLRVELGLAGTAQNGIDFDAIAPSVVIPAGQQTMEIVTKARPDSEQEGTESAVLSVQPAEGYSVGSSSSGILHIYETQHEPWFRPVRLSRSPDGSFALTVELPPQGPYVIEASSDLQTWVAIQTTAQGMTTVNLVDEAARGNSQRYYRARQRP